MNSSFSSISFEAETAIKFKKKSKEKNKTHTELLNELMNFAFDGRRSSIEF